MKKHDKKPNLILVVLATIAMALAAGLALHAALPAQPLPDDQDTDSNNQKIDLSNVAENGDKVWVKAEIYFADGNKELVYSTKDLNNGVLVTYAGTNFTCYLSGGPRQKVNPECMDGFMGSLNNNIVGKEYDFIIPPQYAYGDRNEDKVFSIDQNRFEEDKAVGDEVRVSPCEKCEPWIGTVIEIRGDKVIADFNSKYAGRSFRAIVTITQLEKVVIDFDDND